MDRSSSLNCSTRVRRRWNAFEVVEQHRRVEPRAQLTRFRWRKIPRAITARNDGAAVLEVTPGLSLSSRR
jgi:hypothetical protein